MKTKKILSLLMGCVMLMITSLVAMVASENAVPAPVVEMDDGAMFEIIEGVQDPSVEIMPLDLSIDSGELSNKTGLDMSWKLNKRNGKYVNLYVENKGSNPVVATINGQSERTFERGQKGHIYVEVTQGLFGTDKEYLFKAVPGTNGGSVNIHYEIAQRDTQ